MSDREITTLAKDRESLQWLHREAWRSEPDSYWARAIALLR